MRTDFVANASHELRTPLATLIGFIETLEDAGAAENAATRKRFLGIMMREAKRMQQLIADLVSLSRIEGERFSAPATPIALGTLAAEVRTAILGAQRLPCERIVVENKTDTLVAGDRDQLGQVLHNLIGNAIKYGRADTPVIVSVVPASASRVAISVADRGEGIAREHLPRLTERFYRVDPGRSRSLGGTGLGLAIVKHIVERHRGRLSIESQQGRRDDRDRAAAGGRVMVRISILTGASAAVRHARCRSPAAARRRTRAAIRPIRATRSASSARRSPSRSAPPSLRNSHARTRTSARRWSNRPGPPAASPYSAAASGCASQTSSAPTGS